MKEKKGFTLVELLAVIAILAILVVIATPAVLSMYRKATMNAFETEIRSICRAAKQQYISENTYNHNDGKFTYCQTSIGECVDSKPVDLSGGNNVSYIVTVNKRGEFDQILATNGKYQVNQKNVKDISNIVVQEVTDDVEEVIVTMSNERGISATAANKCFEYKLNSNKTATIIDYKSTCSKNVIIPNAIDGFKVTEIFQYAFYNMGITNVYIPKTVKSIGTRAFGSNKIKSVVIPASVETIGSNSFMSNGLENLTITPGEEGSKAKTIGSQAFISNKLTGSINDYIDGVNISSIGSCAFCKNQMTAAFTYAKNSDGSYNYTTLTGYIGDLSEFKQDKRVIIPPEVNGVKLTTISSSAFSQMSSLFSGYSIVLPDTITTIGSSAFYSCGITAVNLPLGLKSIGSTAFANNSLKTVEIPPTVTSLGAAAFNKNSVSNTEHPDQVWIYARNSDGSVDYSKIISYCGSKRDNLVIPPEEHGVTLTKLGDSALFYLSLTGSIKIPSSVTTLGSNVFYINSLDSVDNGDGNNIYPGYPFVFKRDSTKPGGYDPTVIVAYAGYYSGSAASKKPGAIPVIPEGVKTIGSSAFYYTYVKGVEFPNSLETIGASAFSICALQGTITIPPNVTSIGNNAFAKYISWSSFNAKMDKIINKTGRKFNWIGITGTTGSYRLENFRGENLGENSNNSKCEFCTIKNYFGDILVTGE